MVGGSPVLYASAIPEPGSIVTHVKIIKNNETLFTAEDPDPGVAVSVQDDALAVGETAHYRTLILLRQQAGNNLDGDTVLKYDRDRDQFFQSSEPRLDEQVWTSPVWVTRTAS